MTETLLGLIPDYGLYLIGVIICLACLAVPLPASMMVLAAGGFAAAGDLVLWQVITLSALAYVIGDQLAFAIARLAGPPILDRFRPKPRIGGLIRRSEDMLQQRGRVAVLLSHTVLSPTCPYVCYLCGAGGLRWWQFTPVAIVGACIWAAFYSGMGYAFAGQLTQVTDILNGVFGTMLACVMIIGCGIFLRRRWRLLHPPVASEPVTPQ